MAERDAEMDEFKTEMRRDFTELTANMKELTQAVSKMTTTLAVSEEQKKHQERINENVKFEISSLKKDVTTIKLERASEKQSREFLMKYWPWLLILSWCFFCS